MEGKGKVEMVINGTSVGRNGNEGRVEMYIVDEKSGVRVFHAYLTAEQLVGAISGQYLSGIECRWDTDMVGWSASTEEHFVEHGEREDMMRALEKIRDSIIEANGGPEVCYADFRESDISNSHRSFGRNQKVCFYVKKAPPKGS